LRLAQYSAQLE
jgi:hypothetical protein